MMTCEEMEISSMEDKVSKNIQIVTQEHLIDIIQNIRAV